MIFCSFTRFGAGPFEPFPAFPGCSSAFPRPGADRSLRHSGHFSGLPVTIPHRMVALAEALISPVSRCPGRIRQARAQISIAGRVRTSFWTSGNRAYERLSEDHHSMGNCNRKTRKVARMTQRTVSPRSRKSTRTTRKGLGRIDDHRLRPFIQGCSTGFGPAENDVL